MTKLLSTLFLILSAGFGCVSMGQCLPTAATPQKAGMAARTEPLKVGEMAPDFTLEDQQGQPVKLSAAGGQMPTVLVFYRGYW